MELPVITIQPAKMIFSRAIRGSETMGIPENAMVIAIIVRTITAIAMVDGIMVTAISMDASMVAMVAHPVGHIAIKKGLIIIHYLLDPDRIVTENDLQFAYGIVRSMP